MTKEDQPDPDFELFPWSHAEPFSAAILYWMGNVSVLNPDQQADWTLGDEGVGSCCTSKYYGKVKQTGGHVELGGKSTDDHVDDCSLCDASGGFQDVSGPNQSSLCLLSLGSDVGWWGCCVGVLGEWDVGGGWLYWSKDLWKGCDRKED